MSVELQTGLVLAGGVLNVLVAALILALGPGRALHRAFSALFAARGLANLMPAASADADWTLAALAVQPYFSLAFVPLAIFAAWRIGRPEDQDAASPRAGWLAFAAVAALWALYSFDHSLFNTYERGEAALGVLQAAPGIRYVAFGPLSALAATAPLLAAVVGLRLVLAYRRAAESPGAGPWLLLGAGFLLPVLFDAASRTTALVALLDEAPGFPWTPWGWATVLLPPLAALPAGLGILVLAAGRAFHRPLHALETTMLALCGLAFFSGFLRLALPPTSDPLGGWIGALLFGVWRLAGPLLAAAAFLLPAWRAVEDRWTEGVAWGLAGVAIAAAGLLTHLVASPVVGEPGPLLLALAAAVLAVGSGRGLARLGRWLAGHLMPTRDPPSSPAPALREPSR